MVSSGGYAGGSRSIRGSVAAVIAAWEPGASKAEDLQSNREWLLGYGIAWSSEGAELQLSEATRDEVEDYLERFPASERGLILSAVNQLCVSEGRRRAESDLFWLTQDVLGFNSGAGEDWVDLDPLLHGQLCHKVQCQESGRHLYLLPRGHLKSTIITTCYPIQRILKEPNVRILISNNKLENARTFLGTIKLLLRNNEWIGRHYPGLVPEGRSETWSADKIIVNRSRPLKEPTIQVGSPGGSLVSQHYDLIIMDDIVDPDNSATRDRREAVFEWYRYALSLLEPGGQVIVVGTRYHYDDLYAKLLDSKRYTHHIRKARENGEPIFPAKFTNEYLDEIREDQGPYIFSCQYMNEPVDEETAVFKKSWFRWIKQEHVPDNLAVFQMVDPAISERRESDDTAMVVAGVDESWNIYVFHMVKETMNPSEIIDELFVIYNNFIRRKLEISKISFETVGFQNTIVHFLNREMMDRGQRLPVHPINHRAKTKHQRIMALEPLFKMGQVFFVEGCPLVPELEDQLCKVTRQGTKGKDDLADAFADILVVGSPPMGDKKGIYSPNDRAGIYKERVVRKTGY